MVLESEKCWTFAGSKKDEKLEYDYIRDKCLMNLSTFQLPNKIIFVKEFPKTNLGKIDKIKLMRLYI